MRSRRPVWFWLGIGLVGGAVACVTFSGQKLTYRHQPAEDRLLIFQLYEGIFAAGGSDSEAMRRHPTRPGKKEKEQLGLVIEGGRTFFFSNWILEYDRARCTEVVREMPVSSGSSGVESQPTSRPVSESKSAAAFAEAKRALCQRLVDSVEVTSGGFYRNPQGLLSGYQYVVVHRLSRLVTEINRALSAFVESESLQEFGPEQQKKIRELADRGDWVKLEGSRIHVSLFLTYKEFLEFREDILGKLKRPDILFNYDEPIAELMIGRPEAEQVELWMPVTGKTPNNMLRWVKRKYGLRREVDIEALRREFLSTGAIPGVKKSL